MPGDPQISSQHGVFRAELLGTFGWFLLMASLALVYYIRRQRSKRASGTNGNQYHIVSIKSVEKNEFPTIDSPTGIEEAFDGNFYKANGLEGYAGHEGSL